MIKRVYALLLTATVLLVGAYGFKSELPSGDKISQKPEYIPDRVLVVYKKQAGVSSQLMAKASIESLALDGFIAVSTMTLPSSVWMRATWAES